MNFWEKVKKDLQTGFKDSMEVVKEGAAVVRKKTEELTDEGKRQYKVFDLKTKVHHEIAALGGKVHELSSKVKNPMLDSKVKAILARIKKIEAEITKLEGKRKTAKKKTRKTVKPKSK